MKKSLLAIALLAAATLAAAHGPVKEVDPPPAAQAAAVPRDTWAGAPAHVAVSALAGVVCSTHLYPRESVKAFGCAMVPGVLKELVDSQTKGNRWSNKDIISDAVGSLLGVGAGGWLLTYSERDKAVKVSYRLALD